METLKPEELERAKEAGVLADWGWWGEHFSENLNEPDCCNYMTWSIRNASNRFKRWGHVFGMSPWVPLHDAPRDEELLELGDVTWSTEVSVDCCTTACTLGVTLWTQRIWWITCFLPSEMELWWGDQTFWSFREKMVPYKQGLTYKWIQWIVATKQNPIQYNNSTAIIMIITITATVVVAMIVRA